MKIYSKEPRTWKDLQDITSKYLSEIGYICEIEKTINSARGDINIDVYASNIQTIPNSLLLCECKYWNSKIPQTIIHAFRSVVSDIGANYGFIISKEGFQKGSFASSLNTNITLLTWSQFQDYFRENWIKAMNKKVSILNFDLLTYIGTGFPIFFKQEFKALTKDQQQKFEQLQNFYFHTGFYSMDLDYIDFDTKEFRIEYFYKNILNAEKDFEYKFDSIEDFYNFLIIDGEQGVKEFDELFQKKLRKTY